MVSLQALQIILVGLGWLICRGGKTEDSDAFEDYFLSWELK